MMPRNSAGKSHATYVSMLLKIPLDVDIGVSYRSRLGYVLSTVCAGSWRISLNRGESYDG